MTAADGKQRLAEAADVETLLRIIQSIPSPKAEPVKQWLARVGARDLNKTTRSLGTAPDITAITKPAPGAPAIVWADYFQAMADAYRQLAEMQARQQIVDAMLANHTAQIGELHSRVESLEEGQRLLPEILQRLGPQTLTPEHQGTIKATVRRLSELTGYHFQAIYADLNESFHVARYDQIPEARWLEVSTWLKARVDAAEKRRKQ